MLFFQYKESNAWNFTTDQFLNLMCVYVICNFWLINGNSEHIIKNYVFRIAIAALLKKVMQFFA